MQKIDHESALSRIAELETRFSVTQANFAQVPVWHYLRIWALFSLIGNRPNGPGAPDFSWSSSGGAWPSLAQAEQSEAEDCQRLPPGLVVFAQSVHSLHDGIVVDRDHLPYYSVFPPTQQVRLLGFSHRGTPTAGTQDRTDQSKPLNALEPSWVRGWSVAYRHRALADAMRTLPFEGESQIAQLCAALGIDLPVREIAAAYVAGIHAYSPWFLNYRPRLVLVNRFMWQAHIVASAKRAGSTVVELQQGYLCPHYSTYQGMDVSVRRRFFSDRFLCYSERDCRQLVIRGYATEEQVVPVGIRHLPMLSPEPLPKRLAHTSAQYSTVIAVAATQYFPEEFTSFLLRAAARLPEVLFLVARKRGQPPVTVDAERLPENVVVCEPEVSIYSILSVADLHTTVSSTTAMESLYFGVPNVLMNIRAVAEQRFGAYLASSSATWYADTPEDFALIVSSKTRPSKQQVKDDFDRLFPSCSKDELASVLETQGMA